MLGITVCSLITLKDFPHSLTNAHILGQGNLNLVSEKSGKSQGILLSIICGNPGFGHLPVIFSNTGKLSKRELTNERRWAVLILVKVGGC